MAWDNATVTNSGIALLQQVLEGGELIVDGVAGGPGTVDPAVLKAQTALVDQKQAFTIVGISNVSNGKKFNIQIVNEGLVTGYTLQQVGIWAHVDSGASVLFAIIQDSTGFSIPSEAALAEFTMNILAVVNFSNESSFSFTINSSALVSMGTLLSMLPLTRRHLTLPTTGWEAYTGSMEGMHYQYTFAHTEVLEAHTVYVNPDEESMDQTAICGLGEYCKTYNGGFIVYAEAVPTQAINFSIDIVRGI